MINVYVYLLIYEIMKNVHTKSIIFCHTYIFNDGYFKTRIYGTGETSFVWQCATNWVLKIYRYEMLFMQKIIGGRST